MDAVLPIFMRWLHIASVVVLLGGVFYARVVSGELSKNFKPIGFAAIGGLLLSGIYNFVTKPSYPPTYQMWFGIKMLLALHIFAVVILYRGGKPRSLTGVVISGALVLFIAGYLRWISL
jgi:hypothetical protein